MGSNKHVASTASRHAWRLGEMLKNDRKSGQVGVTVESARGGKYTRYKNRTAIVSTGQGFYDPMESLRRAIHASIDKEESVGEVRKVEACVATPMSGILTTSSKADRTVHFRSAMKRVPKGFIRMWAKRRYDGWFFMYADKVLWVRWSRSGHGWSHSVVPEEGVKLCQ